LAATKKLNAQGTGSEEESVPRQGRRGPSMSWMTAFASFRSDPVLCAASISQRLAANFIDNFKNQSRFALKK